jgi:hypothetical protein
VVPGDIAASGIILVNDNDIVAVPDRLPDKASPDTARTHDDDVPACGLPSSPLK